MCETNKEQDAIPKCGKTWSLINTLRAVGCYLHLWKIVGASAHIHWQEIKLLREEN